MRFDLSILLPHIGFLAKGALLTAEACALALLGSVIMGAFVAIARTSSSKTLRRVAFVYVDIFRNVPFIVQLFFFYYGLPELGIYIDAFTTGVVRCRLPAAPMLPMSSAPGSWRSTPASSKPPKSAACRAG